MAKKASSKSSKLSPQAMQRAQVQVNQLFEQPKVPETIEALARDNKLFLKAKANPRAFLEGRGIKLPSGADVDLEHTVVALKLRITVRICITVCVRVGNFILCTRVCGTVVIAI
jgi:hypothetical protein